MEEVLDSSAVRRCMRLRKLEVIGDRHAEAVALAHERG